MRPEIVEADRRFEVRRAATLWRKAGDVEVDTERAIAARYADDRVRTTRIFRVLFFGFTWFGFTSAFGLFGTFLFAAIRETGGTGAFAFLGLVAGAVALVAAELLHSRMRLRRFGVEEACVWIGISHALGGALWLFFEVVEPGSAATLALGAWGAGCFGVLAAWRWGTPLTGYLAAGGLFVALTQVPFAHLAWLALSFALAWPLGRLCLAAHVSPQGRRRFREAFVVVSVVAYSSIHVAVVESRLLSRLRVGDWERPVSGVTVSGLVLSLSYLAMIVVPVLWMAFGAARRFRPAIDLGALMTLATLVTFTARMQIEPQWLPLIVGGGGLIALALLLRRYFAAAPGGERRGLTALALAEDRASSGTLETLATLAAFTPAARRPDVAGFEGDGGAFGGGGASAKF